MRRSANPAYRVEHVAKTPPGWKVRTKMEATHVLRIAFPPGPRKKGSGKVVEILHPVNENPCALSYTHGVKAVHGPLPGPKSNPDSMEEGENLYREFHGRDPKEVVELQESDVMRKTYVALGPLVELLIDSPAGRVTIGFERDSVKLASDPGGHQLYCIGGNQNLDSQIERFGSDVMKDFIELGIGVKVVYFDRKKIDNFVAFDYEHKLGEETNEPPILFYDKLKKRIFFVGGRYRVEAPGIIN